MSFLFLFLLGILRLLGGGGKIEDFEHITHHKMWMRLKDSGSGCLGDFMYKIKKILS